MAPIHSYVNCSVAQGTSPQAHCILPQSTSAQRPSLVLQPQIYIEHQIRHAPLSRGKRSRHLVWVLSRHSQTVRQPQIHLVTANFSAQKKCQFIVLLSGVYTDVQYTPDERESLSTGEIHFLSTFYSHHQLAYIVESYGESESFALVTLYRWLNVCYYFTIYTIQFPL